MKLVEKVDGWTQFYVMGNSFWAPKVSNTKIQFDSRKLQDTSQLKYVFVFNILSEAFQNFPRKKTWSLSVFQRGKFQYDQFLRFASITYVKHMYSGEFRDKKILLQIAGVVRRLWQNEDCNLWKEAIVSAHKCSLIQEVMSA